MKMAKKWRLVVKNKRNEVFFIVKVMRYPVFFKEMIKLRLLLTFKFTFV